MPAEKTEPSDDVPTVLAKLRRGRVGRARVRRHKRQYWELDFGTFCRRRLRRYASSPTAAYRTAISVSREIAQHGQLARSLTTAQRYEAAKCLLILEPLGTSLLHVVEDYANRHHLGGNARQLLPVIEELVAKKKAGNRRPTYVQDFGWKLRSFEKAFPGRHAASITTVDLEAWLASHPKWGAVTQRSHVQALNVLFNYCVKRGYALDNPCIRLELPEVDDHEPVIFSVDQVRRMLSLTLTTPELRECRAYCAIGTFAGIRPDEMARLQWEQVDFENCTITILGRSAKCRERGVVDMQPNLVAWLRPVRAPAGPVLPAPIAVLRVRIRDAMGLARWPHDVMRHCFGSYHFARFRDERQTMNQMRHGGDPRIFFNHYRALVQPLAAAAFWEIEPAAA